MSLKQSSCFTIFTLIKLLEVQLQHHFVLNSKVAEGCVIVKKRWNIAACLVHFSEVQFQPEKRYDRCRR